MDGGLVVPPHLVAVADPEDDGREVLLPRPHLVGVVDHQHRGPLTGLTTTDDVEISFQFVALYSRL